MSNENSVFKLRRGTTIIVIIACLIGLVFSIMLTNLHHCVYTDPNCTSACQLNSEFNCQTVAESQYSLFLTLPVAVWGIVGYLVMLLLLCLAGKKQNKTAFACLLDCVLFAVLTSISLALVSYCIICSFCLYCTVTYVANVIILITLLFEWRYQKLRFKELFIAPLKFIKEQFPLCLGIIAAVICLLVFYPRYWQEKDLQAGQNSSLEQGSLTEDGLVIIGSKDAQLKIIEFSDYMCPFCARRHNEVRKILHNNLDKMSLVHRHFPLDMECNPLVRGSFHDGSCKLAKLAICVAGTDKFLAVNDALYDLYNSTIPADEKIDKIITKHNLDEKKIRACLTSHETEEKLKLDIETGIALELQATPSFLIDDEIHEGSIDPSVYEKYGIKIK